MFIFLSKLLPLFVYPLGLTCILIAISIILQRHRSLSNILLIIALVTIWLFSTTLVSSGLARSLEWRYLPPAEVPSSDVAVVLGGGTEANLYPRPSVEVNGAGDRVLYAARIFQSGKVEHLLLSGGEITWLQDTQSTPADEMAALLLELGVPSEALWLEDQSKNTYENALFSVEILKDNAVDKVLLITSAIHMPRAVALFQKQGVEVIPLPVDYSVTQNDTTSNNQDWIGQLLGWLPSAGNLNTSTNALKEYLGLLVARLRGWI